MPGGMRAKGNIAARALAKPWKPLFWRPGGHLGFGDLKGVPCSVGIPKHALEQRDTKKKESFFVSLCVGAPNGWKSRRERSVKYDPAGL